MKGGLEIPDIKDEGRRKQKLKVLITKDGGRRSWCSPADQEANDVATHDFFLKNVKQHCRRCFVSHTSRFCKSTLKVKMTFAFPFNLEWLQQQIRSLENIIAKRKQLPRTTNRKQEFIIFRRQESLSTKRSQQGGKINNEEQERGQSRRRLVRGQARSAGPVRYVCQAESCYPCRREERCSPTVHVLALVDEELSRSRKEAEKGQGVQLGQDIWLCQVKNIHL